MGAKQDVAQAYREIDARIEARREQMLAGGDTGLAEGTWSVRDALSHLAARSNGVARVVARAEAAAGGGDAPARPPGGIDEINAGQVEERKDRSVQELIDEILAGHRAATEAVGALDDELLGRSIPMGFRPGEITVAEMIRMGGAGHDCNHFEQIEAVLPQS